MAPRSAHAAPAAAHDRAAVDAVGGDGNDKEGGRGGGCSSVVVAVAEIVASHWWSIWLMTWHTSKTLIKDRISSSKSSTGLGFSIAKRGSSHCKNLAACV